jgi:hypothetical protein
MASICFRAVMVHVVTPSIISSDRTEFSHVNRFPMSIKTSLSEWGIQTQSYGQNVWCYPNENLPFTITLMPCFQINHPTHQKRNPQHFQKNMVIKAQIFIRMFDLLLLNPISGKYPHFSHLHTVIWCTKFICSVKTWIITQLLITMLQETE